MKRLISKVKRLDRRVSKAAAKFVTMEKRLERHNTGLDVTIAEIDEQITSLNELKIAATFRRDENEGFRQRIGQIIRG